MSEALIQYLSPSAMSAYLTNPMYFKKRYIMRQYDTQYSVTGVIGNAGHKALERIYSGMTVDDAILEGQRVIDNMSDMEIKYGSKVPNREKLLINYNRAINFYVAELPQFHKIISIEEAIKEEAESMLHPGTNLPLPLNIRLDLLVANQKKELEVIDHKFVYSYTNPDVDDFKRWLQAMFYYYAVKARYGIAPARMRFKECKTSGNSDGSPQIKEWVFEYDNPQHHTVFERLFTDVVLDMNNPGRLFLPNPNDAFNGQDMFELYRQDIMPVTAPVAVKHRTEEIGFADKQFIPSAGNTADTASYTPEERIRKKLQEFGVPVEMRETFVGPSVIKYTMAPSRGVRMTKVLSHNKDLALALEAESVRIEAPIPGTNLVGIEVPNSVRKIVELTEAHRRPGTLNIPIGVNVHNEVIHKSLADMPHLLIAGATGAGKSVMLNVVIRSLTDQLPPSKLELVLVDPKQVEFAPFEGLKHLAKPVVYDNKGAAEVLAATVKEMESRYDRLRERGVRSIADYNTSGGRMPYRVVILDEFADLMMAADKQPVSSINFGELKENLLTVLDSSPTGRLTQKALKTAVDMTLENDFPPAEESIIRIAQKARAVGIHLILATQRPSADVVTGLIKANIPTKIAFMTTNKVNSQIILDTPGAEELTGKGDMLFADPSQSGLQRLQGLYI